MQASPCRETDQQDSARRCLRLQAARFEALTSIPAPVTAIAGCKLCKASVAIGMPAAGRPTCPYLAHPSVASRLQIALDAGAIDF